MLNFKVLGYLSTECTRTITEDKNDHRQFRYNYHHIAITANEVVYSQDPRWRHLLPLRIEAGKFFIVIYSQDKSLWVWGVHLLLSDEENCTLNLNSDGLLLIDKCVDIDLLSVGDDHILYTTQKRPSRVFSWGRNLYGQLGNGIRSHGINSHPQLIILPGQEEVVINISAGCYFSAIVTVSGAVYTFGSGAYHRLGQLNSTIDQLIPTRLDCLDGVGNLSPSGDSSGISLVSCGKWHAVAISVDSDDVYIWGWCKFGQFGGNTEEEGQLLATPTRISVFDEGILASEEHFVMVVSGNRFTALLTTLGRVLIM